jgi:hypothetical protein
MNNKVNRVISSLLADWSDVEQHKEEHELLKIAAANSTKPEGVEAWAQIVQAMTEPMQNVVADISYTDQEPIRSGLLDEDTVGDIYQVIPVAKGVEIDFPIDFYQATDRDTERMLTPTSTHRRRRRVVFLYS